MFTTKAVNQVTLSKTHVQQSNINTKEESTNKSAGFGMKSKTWNTYRSGADQRIYHHVEDASSNEISDDNEVQLRPNSPYALRHREQTKEHGLPEDRLNRQAFGESGRDYSIWTTLLRIFGTKTSLVAEHVPDVPLTRVRPLERAHLFIERGYLARIPQRVLQKKDIYHRPGAHRSRDLNFEGGISSVSLRVQY